MCAGNVKKTAVLMCWEQRLFSFDLYVLKLNALGKAAINHHICAGGIA